MNKLFVSVILSSFVSLYSNSIFGPLLKQLEQKRFEQKVHTGVYTTAMIGGIVSIGASKKNYELMRTEHVYNRGTGVWDVKVPFKYGWGFKDCAIRLGSPLAKLGFVAMFAGLEAYTDGTFAPQIKAFGNKVQVEGQALYESAKQITKQPIDSESDITQFGN